jgi:hypothetical protein
MKFGEVGYGAARQARIEQREQRKQRAEEE